MSTHVNGMCRGSMLTHINGMCSPLFQIADSANEPYISSLGCVLRSDKLFTHAVVIQNFESSNRKPCGGLRALLRKYNIIP